MFLRYAVVADGAQFFSYCGQQIMYLNGQVIDLFRGSHVLSTLKQLKLADMAYARDTAVYLWHHAKPLYRPIPEGTLGTINGIKEPELRMTRYLHKCVGHWVKQVIESGTLSPTQGE